MTAISHTEAVDLARSWIASDRDGVLADVKRFGELDAARYNTDMAAIQAASDERWVGVTYDAMLEAIVELVDGENA